MPKRVISFSDFSFNCRFGEHFTMSENGGPAKLKITCRRLLGFECNPNKCPIWKTLGVAVLDIKDRYRGFMPIVAHIFKK